MLTKELLDGCTGDIAIATHVGLHNAFMHWRNRFLSRHPALVGYLKQPKAPKPPLTREEIAHLNRLYQFEVLRTMEEIQHAAVQLKAVAQ